MNSSKLKILFSGMVAGDPHQGGATWAVLQYVLGLRELGHDVLLVEPVKPTALQPAGTLLVESANASYFCDVMEQFQLTRHSALLEEGTRQTIGLTYDAIVEFGRQADVLINVSGMLTDRLLIDRIATRAYLDLDPAFIQIWHAVERIDMRLSGHTHFITVGLALGSPECRAPTCGRRWITTLQPVALSHWPVGTEIKHDAFTTVGNWRGYGSVHYDGEFLGQKAHSFRELMELPQLAGEKFLLAMAIHPDETKDLSALHKAGWRLTDPGKVAANPLTYREFIRQSKGELGVAKSGYVRSRCGWFSDRSACYLAAGRPVVAQDTGFSRYLPTGEGLLAFNSLDDAIRAIDCVNENYPRHARAARALAETHLSSAVVLPRLLQQLG
ncbi:MAG TPA: hypothetical protein VF175_05580 [Lacipirellula sp.]